MRKLALAAVVAASLLLGGCGTVTLRPPPATPTVAGVTEAPATPAPGAHYVTIERLGLRMQVPDGWVVLDYTKPEVGFDEVAKSTGLKAADIVSAFEYQKVVKIMPADAKDIIEQGIDVRIVPGTELPDQAAAEERIGSFGGSVGELAEIVTPAGPGVRVPYVVKLGAEPSACELVVIQHGESLISITMAMPSIPLVEALTTLVSTSVTTLEPVE